MLEIIGLAIWESHTKASCHMALRYRTDMLSITALMEGRLGFSQADFAKPSDPRHTAVALAIYDQITEESHPAHRSHLWFGCCDVHRSAAARASGVAAFVPPGRKDRSHLVNHVGFPPHAAKRCVISAPPEKTFTIHRLKDTVWKQEFCSTLVNGGPELEPDAVGDFTPIKDDGIYQVRCGTLRSRSSDLRKWSAFEILGLMGLLEYGQKEAPRWDNGSIAEEARWGCDYFQKPVRSDGGMYDSVFSLSGGGRRTTIPLTRLRRRFGT